MIAVISKHQAHAFSFAGIDPLNPDRLILEFSALGKGLHVHKTLRGALPGVNVEFYVRNYIFDLVPCTSKDCHHQLKTDGSPEKPLVTIFAGEPL